MYTSPTSVEPLIVDSCSNWTSPSFWPTTTNTIFISDLNPFIAPLLTINLVENGFVVQYKNKSYVFETQESLFKFLAEHLNK